MLKNLYSPQKTTEEFAVSPAAHSWKIFKCSASLQETPENVIIGAKTGLKD